MREASDQLEFELAARVRDQLASVRKAIERQQMVGAREEDFDLIGLDEDALEASVQVFYVRKGRVVGRKGLIVDKVEDVETPALVARVVEQLYADAPATTSRRRSSSRSSPKTSSSTRSSSRSTAARRCASACRSAAASASCSRPRCSTRARVVRSATS